MFVHLELSLNPLFEQICLIYIFRHEYLKYLCDSFCRFGTRLTNLSAFVRRLMRPTYHSVRRVWPIGTFFPVWQPWIFEWRRIRHSFAREIMSLMIDVWTVFFRGSNFLAVGATERTELFRAGVCSFDNGKMVNYYHECLA